MSGKISELLAAKKAANAKQAPVSFEYYPPRTEDGKNNLLKRARDMKDMGMCSSLGVVLAHDCGPIRTRYGSLLLT